MRPGAGVGRGLLVAGVLAFAWAGAARAAVRKWNNPNGGSFQDPGNWQGGVAPGTFDVPLFDYDGRPSYMVFFENQATFITARVGDDDVAFDLRGHDFVLTGKATDGNSLTVAAAAGQQGAVRIGGGGRLVTAGIVLLAGGTGSSADVTFAGGGRLVSNGLAVLAGGAGSTARVTLAGPDAQWEAAKVTVGSAGAGHVEVSGGGLLKTTGTALEPIILGGLASARGEVAVRGPGSRWDAAGFVVVADGGQGTVSVLDGAAVTGAGSFELGRRTVGAGRVVVSGVNGTRRSTIQASNFNVGSGGAGTLLVQNGARAEFYNITQIATGSGGAGSAIVGGEAGGFAAEMVAGGLDIAAGFNDGPAYTGLLTVNEGGRVTVSGQLFLGPPEIEKRGTGTLNVQGGQLQAREMFLFNGAVNLDAGSFKVGIQHVGGPNSTSATFTQNGGTNSGSVEVGSGGTGAGTYNLRGGTLMAGVTNNPRGTFNHTGGTVSGAVTNAGTWTAGAPPGGAGTAAADAPVVSGTFTNRAGGIVRVNGAAVRFDGDQFLNDGTFFSDGGRSRFTRFRTTAAGSVRAVGEAELTIGRELWVEVADPARWDAAAARVSFDDAAADLVTTYLASVPGVDRGEDGAGYRDNYALGALRVSAGDFVDFRPNSAGHAVYVGELAMDGGVDEFSHLHSDTFPVNVYYDERLPGNAYLGGMRYHGVGVEIVPVPEPGAAVLALAAAGMLRRRARA